MINAWQPSLLSVWKVLSALFVCAWPQWHGALCPGSQAILWVVFFVHLAVCSKWEAIMLEVDVVSRHYCFWTILAGYAALCQEVIQQLITKNTICVVICIGIYMNRSEWQTACTCSVMTQILCSTNGLCLLALVRLSCKAAGTLYRSFMSGTNLPLAVTIITWNLIGDSR